MIREFNEYVRECFSEAGEIVIKSMMGGYLVYFNGKLIGDVCGDELFLKRTPTSDIAAPSVVMISSAGIPAACASSTALPMLTLHKSPKTARTQSLRLFWGSTAIQCFMPHSQRA